MCGLHGVCFVSLHCVAQLSLPLSHLFPSPQFPAGSPFKGLLPARPLCSSAQEQGHSALGRQSNIHSATQKPPRCVFVVLLHSLLLHSWTNSMQNMRVCFAYICAV